MRLIDADKLEYGIVSYIGEFSRVPLDDIIKGWQKIVDAQPTAYDVDKVLEQLRQKIDLMEIYDAEVRAYRNAEKIVKAGGANG